MGEAFRTHGREHICIQIGFNTFSPKERDHLEELGTYGRMSPLEPKGIILNFIFC